MKLYVMRHGEYSAQDIKNHHPLTEKGRQDIGRLARFLHDAKISIGEIYHSEQRRAKETAEIMASGLLNKVEIIEKTGLNPHDDIHAFIAEVNTLEVDTLIVGHLPFMGKLVNQLVVQNEDRDLVDFVTGTLLCLEKIDTERFILNWILRPDLF